MASTVLLDGDKLGIQKLGNLRPSAPAIFDTDTLGFEIGLNGRIEAWQKTFKCTSRVAFCWAWAACYGRAHQFSLGFYKLLHSFFFPDVIQLFQVSVISVLLLFEFPCLFQVLSFPMQYVLQDDFFVVQPTIWSSKVFKIWPKIGLRFTQRSETLHTHVMTGFLHGCKLNEQQSNSFILI